MQVETGNFISDPSVWATQTKRPQAKKTPLYLLSNSKSSQPSRLLSENKSSGNMTCSSKEWNSCQHVYQFYPKARKRYSESNILIHTVESLTYSYINPKLLGNQAENVVIEIKSEKQSFRTCTQMIKNTTVQKAVDSMVSLNPCNNLHRLMVLFCTDTLTHQITSGKTKTFYPVVVVM